jgi:death-on-curing protein
VIVYLAIDQVLDLHRGLVEAFGGLLAVRDRGLLEAAVARPAMTFGGEDLYADLAAKAAALMHSLVLNHPFMDGNKRIGVAAAELFVECNASIIQATDEEFEGVALRLAEGAVAVEALTIWFRQRLRVLEVD